MVDSLKNKDKELGFDAVEEQRQMMVSEWQSWKMIAAVYTF